MNISPAHVKWIIITGIIILIPMIFGIINSAKLPDKVAVHFGIDGKPNGWANKNVVIFGIPLGLLVVQLIVFFAFEATHISDILGNVFYSVIMCAVPFAAVVTAVTVYAAALKK